MKQLFLCITFISLAHAAPRDLIEAIQISDVKKVEAILQLEELSLTDQAHLADLAQNIIDKRKSESIVTALLAGGLSAISLKTWFDILSKQLDHNKVITYEPNLIDEVFYPVDLALGNIAKRQKDNLSSESTLFNTKLHGILRAFIFLTATTAGIIYFVRRVKSNRYNDAILVKGLIQNANVRSYQSNGY